MLNHWNKLLSTDCCVVRIKKFIVYPIFKVGSTSLKAAAVEQYINNDIGKCKHIHILLRDPEERFISGLNQYCRFNGMDIKDTWERVNRGGLIDRHFAPQYIWLLHLYKYYRGEVTLRPFKFINKITDVHSKKDRTPKQIVPVLKSFVEIDHHILKQLGKRIELRKLIEEHRHVLP